MAELPIRTSPPLTLAGWLRHEAIRRALRELPSLASVLEIGAGEGALGARLAIHWEYVGVEPDDRARARANDRLAEARRGKVVPSLEGIDPARRFDLVCAFEVLEHIPDDVQALVEWRAWLRPDGALLISVPAGERRFGAADRYVGHERRYEPATLRAALAEAGFEISRAERVGLPLGYVLEALRHVVAARAGGREGTPGSGRWLQPPDRLGLATRAATAPFRAFEARLPPLRPGTNLVALARIA